MCGNPSLSFSFPFLQIRTYYAENTDVDLLFHTDHLDDLLEYRLSVDWVPRGRLHARFGPRPDLTPHARGNLVEGTFCERVFHDCSRHDDFY